METLTAAHPTLPLPSMVKVTNLRNSKSVVVRVNDRGPFAKERIIDVSERAAEMLGFKDKGTTEVKVELLRSETEELLKKLKLKNSGI
jgi:rare lipoprotein A